MRYVNFCTHQVIDTCIYVPLSERKMLAEATALRKHTTGCRATELLKLKLPAVLYGQCEWSSLVLCDMLYCVCILL